MKTMILAIGLLAGCSSTPERVELFSCVSEPRPEYELEVTYVPFFATDIACRKQAHEHNSGMLPPILSWYAACATVPCDNQLADGETPWCQVVLPDGVEAGDSMWEHETAHCEGWAR